MDEASKAAAGCGSQMQEAIGAQRARGAGEVPETGARSRVARCAWGALGAVFFALGVVGSVLPLIPTTPFILVAALCFARSSTRLNRWFRSTKLCRLVFENYLTRRAMTWVEKLRVLVPVFLFLLASFILLEPVPAGRVAVAVVFAAHVVYFCFIVKTKKRSVVEQQAERD